MQTVETKTINCKTCHNDIDSLNCLDCPHCHANNQSIVGKYLVAVWGYSMTLATWVKVISATDKTLLVQEVDGKNHSTAGYLQYYTVPTDNLTHNNGKEQASFRLYKRNDCFTGHPPSLRSKMYFSEWDGKPVYENHCD